MIKVALLDDDKNVLELVKRIVGLELRESDEMMVFINPKTLIEELKNGNSFDVLISDIEMPQMNGIHMITQYKELFQQTYLIYLTSYSQYAAESYLVDAYQYVLKEDMDQRLSYVLAKLFRQIRKEKQKYRMVGSPTNRETVFYRNIVYICKDKGSKYVNYITINGVYKERITINQLLDELNSEEFVLVERGYIININHISNMQKNIIFMDNGEKIISSRAHFKKVKEKINIYRGKL